MTKLSLIRPEVAGGFGEKTIISNFNELESGLETIPKIIKLEYVFDDWLGDELIRSSPCFIATENLITKLGKETLSGYLIDEVLISKSDLEVVSKVVEIEKMKK